MTRVSDRIGTKSAQRKKCQGLTKGQKARAHRQVNGKSRITEPKLPYTRVKVSEPKLETFTVLNFNTKKTLDVQAIGFYDAIQAAVKAGLARKPENLKVVPF